MDSATADDPQSARVLGSNVTPTAADTGPAEAGVRIEPTVGATWSILDAEFWTLLVVHLESRVLDVAGDRLRGLAPGCVLGLVRGALVGSVLGRTLRARERRAQALASSDRQEVA
ncbi:MAG: hypothetical protein JOZ87_24690 [Chloroflexi bacterium]|nr:hypothetical protein [Chloroflexota bacterium]